MNLYKFHDKPESLDHYDLAQECVLPELYWRTLCDSNDSNKGISKIIASAIDSYYYAKDILEARFKLGEPAIAKDAEYSFEYAKNVLKGRFEAGEKAIAKDAEFSVEYSVDVLKGPFKLGEPAIYKNQNYSATYTEFLNKLQK